VGWEREWHHSVNRSLRNGLLSSWQSLFIPGACFLRRAGKYRWDDPASKAWNLALWWSSAFTDSRFMNASEAITLKYLILRPLWNYMATMCTLNTRLLAIPLTSFHDMSIQERIIQFYICLFISFCWCRPQSRIHKSVSQLG
jgi:hypothetical protein